MMKDIEEFTKRFDKNKSYNVFGKLLMSWNHNSMKG